MSKKITQNNYTFDDSALNLRKDPLYSNELNRINLYGSTYDYSKYLTDFQSLHINFYNDFIQMNVPKEKRENRGLESLFRLFFPIKHAKTNITINYLDYEIVPSQFSSREAILRGTSYCYVLKIHVEIVTPNDEEPQKHWIVVGEIPAMTDGAIFIINGHSRIFVTELIKSPGIAFTQEPDNLVKGEFVYIAKLAPEYGSWLHFKLDRKGLSANLDKKTKINLIMLLKALPKNEQVNVYNNEAEMNNNSYTIAEIFSNFYTTKEIQINKGYAYYTIDLNKFKNVELQHDIYNTNFEKIYTKGSKILDKKTNNIIEICCPIKELNGFYLAEDITLPNGEIVHLSRPISELKESELNTLSKIKVYEYNDDNMPFLLESFAEEFSSRHNAAGIFSYTNELMREQALKILSRSLRINAYHNTISLANIMERKFFDIRSYDLTEVGRFQLNNALKLNKTEHYVTFDDIISTIKYLIKFSTGKAKSNNIDSLQKKIVYSCYDALYEYMRTNFNKWRDTILDRPLNLQQTKALSLVLNISTLTQGIVNKIMMHSHLYNDLNYISIMSQHSKIDSGSVGSSKERIPTAKRDIHHSQIGRICTIQTAEGKKVGLTTYMTSFCKIDMRLRFLLCPYYIVENGIVTKNIVYYNSYEDHDKVIGDISMYKWINNELKPISDYVLSIKNGFVAEIHYTEVELIMISNSQMNSIATSLVPRIETNDVYRTMVGANMHLQAMPILYSEPPILSTGMDKYVANRIISPINGKVIAVDMERIILSGENEHGEPEVCKIELEINKKTNATTYCSHKALVNIGDTVQIGDLIADGFSTMNGELAIGRNFLVLFSSRDGTYEDSAVVSSGLHEQGLCSSPRKSVHTCIVQDTRLGTEQLTKNIPGCSIIDTRFLDESGIIQIGTKVSSGQILVGKITPQSTKTDMDVNESKLIKILLNDFDNSYKDTSLRVPPYTNGTVIGVEVLTSKTATKDDRTLMYEQKRLSEIESEVEEINNIIMAKFKPKFVALFKKHGISTTGLDAILKIIKIKSFVKKFEEFLVHDDIRKLYQVLLKHKEKVDQEYTSKLADINLSYEITDGHLKIIRVYIMEQHTISVGDKIAGRCANKAVVSRIMPKCDMPFLPDGTPVDIILSSLGVVARMNYSQIFEAMIGYVIWNLRKDIGNIIRKIDNGIIQEITAEIRLRMNELVNYATGYTHIKRYKKNIFIREASTYTNDEIVKLMRKIFDKGIYVSMEQFACLNDKEFTELLQSFGEFKTFKTHIYDGKTGEKSETEVTVGYVYIMALHHTAHSKIHARSTGPVSTMSLQPVYGRARFGGQRFGEMEVWAEKAKGHAYIIQELLNPKSDSLIQKNMMVKSIIEKGSFSMQQLKAEPSEGFRTLASLLFACGIDIILLDNDNNPIEDWYHIDLNQPHLTNAKFKITLLSNEKILSRSKGQVLSAETHHFKSFEPISKGLCDMAIFGPIKNYVCKCGELKGRRNSGLRCPKCKVLSANSLVRREHFGHVELAAYITHPLFMRRVDNKISYLLGYSHKVINEIVSLESYIITDIDDDVIRPNGLAYKVGDIITSEEYNRIKRIMETEKIIDYVFKAVTGGEAIKYLIDNINITEKLRLLRQQAQKETSIENRMEIAEKIVCLKNIVERKVPLSGLVLKNLPICPANLRPIVELSPGNFAASDLNWLYKVIIIRNAHLFDMNHNRFYFDLMKTYQILLLSKSIGDVIGNTGGEYKSIGESLSGKDGILRRQLLGKRVDFAGRAVIVTAPNTKLDECYIPEEIAIELCTPHLINKLIKGGVVNSIKLAQEMINNRASIIYTILPEILKTCLVALNRAPTLHRVSMMYFKPILWKENAIGLNPLTCFAYNADFDGDQMCLHLVLSTEATAEAYLLGRPSVNIGSVANGGFIVGAFKDLIYGIYALTTITKFGERMFYNINDALMAYESGEIELRETFNIYLPPEMAYNGQRLVQLTVGRIKFMEIVPTRILNIMNLNKVIEKSDINAIILRIRIELRDRDIVDFMNKVQQIGFKYATYFKASFGLVDFIYDDEIYKIIQKARNKRIAFIDQFNGGFISHQEFDKKCLDLSNDTRAEIDVIISTFMKKNKQNPVIQIVESGARGTKSNLMQIYGVKGNPVDMMGKTSSMMVFGNHVNGIYALDYFSLALGARKSIRDVALSTAEAGYLTRKLVDVAHSAIITMVDCKTSECILAKNMYKDGRMLYSIYDQCLGRTLAKPIVLENVVLKTNTLLSYNEIELLMKNDIQEIYIFSPVLCAAVNGVCVKCYGADLSTMKPIACGDVVGVIAAQSMGEPSTQLTMRSFHSGGVSKSALSNNKILSSANGKLRFKNMQIVIDKNGNHINISRNMTATISNHLNHNVIEMNIPYGSQIHAQNESQMNINDIIAIVPSDIPCIAHENGFIVFENIFEGVNSQKIVNEGTANILIKPHATIPIIKIMNDNGSVVQQIYLLENTLITVVNGQQVSAGDVFAYIRKNKAESDITTEGLQYITNILENTTPDTIGVIAPVSGTIKFKQTAKKTVIVIIDEEGNEHTLSKLDIKNSIYGHDNKVNKGDIISFGVPLMQDILQYRGIYALIDYFVSELQFIYLNHSLNVNNKHFEVVLSQMTRMYMITENEHFGQVMNKFDICNTFINNIKEKQIYESLSETKCRNFFNKHTQRQVIGITQSALNCSSFLSEISFQTTIKGIVNSALNGAIDPMHGTKPYILTGKHPNFGTGYVLTTLIGKNSV